MYYKLGVRFILALVLLALSSCHDLSQNSNKSFNEKYREDVEEIVAKRKVPEELKNQAVFITPPTTEELQSDPAYNRLLNPFPYVNVNNFGKSEPRQFMPNGESYDNMRASNPADSLPSDMFQISYNTTIYSGFKKIGSEFDYITIPPQDVYGVTTSMNNKSYMLIGNLSLQKKLDQMYKERARYDDEISATIIKEQKRIKQIQRLRQGFVGGEEELQLMISGKRVADKKKEDQSTETESATSKESESVKKPGNEADSKVITNSKESEAIKKPSTETDDKVIAK